MLFCVMCHCSTTATGYKPTCSNKIIYIYICIYPYTYGYVYSVVIGRFNLNFIHTVVINTVSSITVFPLLLYRFICVTIGIIVHMDIHMFMYW
jgi:hypothetical protein